VERQYGKTFEVRNPPAATSSLASPTCPRPRSPTPSTPPMQPERLGRKTGKERAKILHRWYELMMEHQETSPS
jgi:hypothetical protein